MNEETFTFCDLLNKWSSWCFLFSVSFNICIFSLNVIVWLVCKVSFAGRQLIACFVLNLLPLSRVSIQFQFVLSIVALRNLIVTLAIKLQKYPHILLIWKARVSSSFYIQFRTQTWRWRALILHNLLWFFAWFSFGLLQFLYSPINAPYVCILFPFSSFFTLHIQL